MHDRKKRPVITVETIIVIAIGCCMLFLNWFTTTKLSELERAGKEAMFIKEDVPYLVNDELNEEILEYRPMSCKAIEVYGENYELLFSLQFSENRMPDYDIQQHQDLLKLLQEQQEGQTLITLGDYEENVYFQWTNNTEGESRLVIVYSDKPVVQNIWIFNFVCYMVMILVFVLLIRLHVVNYKEHVDHYKCVSDVMLNK